MHVGILIIASSFGLSVSRDHTIPLYGIKKETG
jgi:hypothetical protein